LSKIRNYLFGRKLPNLIYWVLKGSEGYVRHCRLGAGSPLKRSGPLGFAVAQRGFRGFARGLYKLLFYRGSEGYVPGAGSPLKRGTARLSRLRPGLYKLLL